MSALDLNARAVQAAFDLGKIADDANEHAAALRKAGDYPAAEQADRSAEAARVAAMIVTGRCTF